MKNDGRVDERIDEGVILWDGHIERMGNDRIFMCICVYIQLICVYGREWEGICLMGHPRKRWSDSVNDCLKKRGLNEGESKKNGG